MPCDSSSDEEGHEGVMGSRPSVSRANRRGDLEAGSESDKGSEDECIPDDDCKPSQVQRPLSEFEQFPSKVHHRRLPIVVFTDDVGEQQVWHGGAVLEGQVKKPAGAADVRAVNPIVMSPAMLGFAIEPYEPRYLHYRGVGIVFARPSRGRFMQPSIDTMLLCYGLAKVFEDSSLQFGRAIDVGSGSGFLGKFAAAHAPGVDALEVTLIDIDPAALKYSQSPGFNQLAKGVGGRDITWQHQTGDAVEYMDKEAVAAVSDPNRGYDLIIANPPYIPTYGEVTNDEVLNAKSGFWEGIGLVVYLIELITTGSACRPAAHLVLQITSLTLKAPQVRAALDAAAVAGLTIRIMVEREIGWKAWYAGPVGNNHLMATNEEETSKRLIGGCKMFVGATEPSRPRHETTSKKYRGYEWHIGYVLDISRPAQQGTKRGRASTMAL
eukprot:TRINITY_DN38488_c0_g1_i1.p1 TRINITY_DN38488_c0_g1~~TRINITY_DN38488_c0_g1_i1.p1  ORF type:complete len:437 (+),score=57.09 TRINITY_DN38488_c0_g1_i1:77-1387(+)